MQPAGVGTRGAPAAQCSERASARGAPAAGSAAFFSSRSAERKVTTRTRKMRAAARGQ